VSKRAAVGWYIALLALLLIPQRLVNAQGLAPGAPRNLALLIGVSRYPSLPKDLQLNGPANDVTLMRQVLEQRGFQVTALGEAASGEQPTRRSIVAAMQRLAQEAGRGDFVFLLFSGHGSQQPEEAATGYPRKPDGLDETFLPSDIGRWSDTTETVAGALLDHEVGSLINAIRNKGAFVWSVFDSCHSATMTRAVRRTGERDRRVLPQVLGVPVSAGSKHRAAQAAPRATGARFLPPVSLQPDAGGSVAFYATETTETTPELPLPAGDPNRKTYGLFTYTLAQAIAAGPSASYRQLAQYTLQSYAAMNRDSPTPLFEGDLDRTVFGANTAAHMVRQWALSTSSDGIVLAAGRLNQIDKGALLLVLPTPTAPDQDALGVVKVEEALPTTSRVDWTSDATLLERAGWKLPAGRTHPARPPPGSFARLATAGLSLDVKVADPIACREGPVAGSAPVCSPGDAGPDPQLLALVRKSLQVPAEQLPANVTVVKASADADIRPLLFRDRLWLAPPGGELVTQGATRTYSLPFTFAGTEDAGTMVQALRASLFDALAREARAINLRRMAAQTTLNATLGLEVTLSVVTGGTRGADSSIVPPGSVPTLQDGDRVEFLLANHGEAPVDVTLLDIGPSFGIAPVFPESGESNRLVPGASVPVSGRIAVRQGDAGRETMLIIATPPEPDRQDFSDLAQPPLDRSARRPELHDTHGIAQLLWEAAFGGHATTRELRRSDPAEILSFSWNTRAP
jgi:hypothetical protein